MAFSPKWMALVSVPSAIWMHPLKPLVKRFPVNLEISGVPPAKWPQNSLFEHFFINVGRIVPKRKQNQTIKSSLAQTIPKNKLPGKWLNGLDPSFASPDTAVLSTSNVPLWPLRVKTAICRLPSSTRMFGFGMTASSFSKRNANSKKPSTTANEM